MLADRALADDLPAFNMTPMVDVVLCLLIFFMAATRVDDADEDQFTVRVPEVSGAAPLTAAPDELSLNVRAPGRVEMGGAVYGLDALGAALAEARARYADQAVSVRGEASLSYQALADVLATCEGAGIKSVRLPVRPRPPAGSPKK